MVDSLSNRYCLRWNTLWTIAIVLMILWLFGLVTSYKMGGIIHVLVIIAIIVVPIRIIQGRKIPQSSFRLIGGLAVLIAPQIRRA